jgi:ketosteroid isomerase-like protein
MSQPATLTSTERVNQELVVGAYSAFAEGDVAAVFEALAEDVLWHVPGRGPLSRDYRGHREVQRFFEHFMELSNGTFRIAVDEVLAKGDRVIVLVTESARRRGHEWSSPQVHAWTVRDGKATIFWQFQGDQQTEDEFWA